MNFENFIEQLTECLLAHEEIPHDFNFNTVIKNNGVTYKALSIHDINSAASPNIILDNMYDEYIAGTSIEDITDRICSIYLKHRVTPEKSDLDISWSAVKDKIFMALINYNSNIKLLETTPHIRILDLAVIFKIDIVFQSIDGNITISNSILNSFNISFDELLLTAIINTPKNFPILFRSLKDTIPTFFETVPDYEDIPDLWVVSNTRNNYGATAILYPELAERLSRLYSSEVYLLPSSIHEFLIIEAGDDTDRNVLKDIVMQVNNSPAIYETEYLSDSVYTYMELSEAFINECKKYGYE